MVLHSVKDQKWHDNHPYCNSGPEYDFQYFVDINPEMALAPKKWVVRGYPRRIMSHFLMCISTPDDLALENLEPGT